jgi:hypothetical protein
MPSNDSQWCDRASEDSCFALCGAPIAGQATLCASRLLEDASYGSTGVSQVFCSAGYCTMKGPNGQSCTFHSDAERAACRQMLYPPKKVACSQPTFRPVTECASVCTK